MEEIIRTENLTKHYGDVHAVDGISISVGKGEIYGFIGLNGVGKTTTIRMLLGMIKPTSGAAYLNNKKVEAGNHKLWESIGYMVEVPYSYPELTVWENLEIVRRLRGITEKSSVDSVIDRLKLTAYRNRKAKHLSLGNAQRLGIAKAMIHNPRILILDEPINALDPAGIVEIRELLLDITINKGVTVFISSHILGEVAKLANRIGIINKGRLIKEVNSNRLDTLLTKRLLVSTNDLEAAYSTLSREGYIVNLDEKGKLVLVDEKAIRHPELIGSILFNAGLPPTLLKTEVEDLESYFLRTIGMNGGN